MNEKGTKEKCPCISRSRDWKKMRMEEEVFKMRNISQSDINAKSRRIDGILDGSKFYPWRIRFFSDFDHIFCLFLVMGRIRLSWNMMTFLRQKISVFFIPYMKLTTHRNFWRIRFPCTFQSFLSLWRIRLSSVFFLGQYKLNMWKRMGDGSAFPPLISWTMQSYYVKTVQRRIRFLLYLFIKNGLETDPIFAAFFKRKRIQLFMWKSAYSLWILPPLADIKLESKENKLISDFNIYIYIKDLPWWDVNPRCPHESRSP